MIRISPIRLVGPEGEQIGIVETAEALRMAQEAGLDLVEVVATSRPPVCKIMDYGKYRFELSQKERQSRAASKQAELKEIRLGRSMKIDPHDVQIRIDQARRFLMDGHKVQVTARFKGREMQHQDIGMENLREFVDALSDIAKVEVPPRWAGRQASLILAPDKVRVEAIRRKLEKDKAESGEEDPHDSAASNPEADNAQAEDADRKKRKGPADDRKNNPVDDELDELLNG